MTERARGGPTRTIALQPGSPAIDKGKDIGPDGVTPTGQDQRGFPRPVDDPAIPNATGGDGSDIGAFQHTPGAPAVGRAASQASTMWPFSLAGISIAILLGTALAVFRKARNRGMDRCEGD